MRNTLETRLGVFFALALFVAVLILEMVGAFDFFRGGFQIAANFRNVQELKKGDLVKMSGVEIGRIEAIDLVQVPDIVSAQRTNLPPPHATNAPAPGATNAPLPHAPMVSVAQVTMKIRNQFKSAITTESIAQIKATGLLGQNYVSIDPGKGSPVQTTSDKSITLQATEPTDLNELISVARQTLTNINVAAAGLAPGSTFGPINDFLRQNTPYLNATIGNLKMVSDNLAQGKGTVGKLLQNDELYLSAYGAITNIQAASADLKHLMSQAETMIGETRQIVSGIGAGQGTLGRLAKEDALYIQATNMMANLGQIFSKINTNYGTLGKLVNDESLYRNAKLGLQKLEKATEGFEDQGPLSVLGIAAGSLF
ncbi:MAG: MCE family protein [Verrucomicrobia bacterium]|nr:MCE family protein [Verrucomicrobiota bacterium]